jgi:putative peptide zinc metalloprotease protein
LVAFVLGASAAHHALAGHHGELALVVIPAFFVAIFLHEAGHAFTVKAFGRQVNRAGIGWYWFAPVAFVDTSDMWLASARQRMVVSAAGPSTNLILGSAAAIAAAAATSEAATAVLWSFAVPNYLAVIINLNPLLEFDGYHILSDVLDRPNLRTEALHSMTAAFPHLIRDRRHDRRGTTDLLFGIGSVLYVLAMAAAMLVIYRLTIQKWIGSLLPTSVAAALAWALVGTVSALVLLGVIADLRTARSGTEIGQQRE